MPKVTKQKLSTRPKISTNSWLVIANIVITITTGIYLAIRNENFQKQLVSLQSQTKLATIIITQDKSPNAFNISNQGLAIAENVKIVLCTNNIIYGQWHNIDTDRISITTDNTAINFTLQKNEQNSGNVNNCETLTLTSIVPGESIGFELKARDMLSTKEQFAAIMKTSREFFIVIPKGIVLKYGPPLSAESAVIKYRIISSDYNFTTVTVDASCTNCDIQDWVESISLSYPLLGSGTLSTTESETENYVKFRKTVTFSYSPEDSKGFPDTPVYLKILSDISDKDIEFEIINQQEYDALK